MRKIITLTLWLGGITLLTAQEELGVHLLRDAWPANRTNPAILPSNKLVIGLPGIYNNLLLTNITYADLAVTNEKGEEVIDVNNAIPKLTNSNLVRENLDIETLSAAFRLGKISLSLGHALRFGAYFNYPKTLPQLIWQGNAQFIGQNVDFSTDMQLNGYHEWYAGVAVTPIQGLTVGARAKYLSGIADVSTERKRLQLFTDSVAYALTLDADLLVNSAGVLEYESIRDLRFNFDFGKLETEHLFSKNNGYAIDLGVYYQTKRWDFAASVLDLGGKIDWKENVKNYSISGVTEFKGLDVAQQLLDDSTNVGSVLDTLEQLYQPTETQNAYTTKLAPRYYLSASYTLNDTWRFGALYYTETYRGEAFPAFAVSAHATLLKKMLQVGVLYAYRNESLNNIGANILVKLGPVQILAATDNVLTVFQPKRTHSANARLGLSLLLGK